MRDLIGIEAEEAARILTAIGRKYAIVRNGDGADGADLVTCVRDCGEAVELIVSPFKLYTDETLRLS